MIKRRTNKSKTYWDWFAKSTTIRNAIIVGIIFWTAPFYLIPGWRGDGVGSGALNYI